MLKLSPREQIINACLDRGLPIEAIAAELDMSVKRLKVVIRVIMNKQEYPKMHKGVHKINEFLASKAASRGSKDV